MAKLPKYVQEIEEAVKRTRTHFKKYKGHIYGNGKEYQTRYWLIDPILRALDWNVNDPGQVWIERSINGVIADYVMFVSDPDRPAIVLEAKSIDKVKAKGFEFDAVNQLRSQSGELDRGYGVLSCGFLWNIFDLRKEPHNPRNVTDFRRKRIADFNIMSSSPEECAKQLKVLHRTWGKWK